MYICFTANPFVVSFVGTISGRGSDNGCSRSGAPPGVFDLCPAQGEDVTINCTTSHTTLITFTGGSTSSQIKTIPSIDAGGTFTCTTDDTREFPCSSDSETLDIELICELHNNDTHMYM